MNGGHTLASFLPFLIQVQSNEPTAIYTLVQKERELKFPFQITEDGEILLTEELDREEKNMVHMPLASCAGITTDFWGLFEKLVLVLFQYILVVQAADSTGKQVEPPMEIVVLVADVNDNAPVCEDKESVFELQENEPIGKVWSPIHGAQCDTPLYFVFIC